MTARNGVPTFYKIRSSWSVARENTAFTGTGIYTGPVQSNNLDADPTLFFYIPVTLIPKNVRVINTGAGRLFFKDYRNLKVFGSG